MLISCASARGVPSVSSNACLSASRASNSQFPNFVKGQISCIPESAGCFYVFTVDIIPACAPLQAHFPRSYLLDGFKAPSFAFIIVDWLGALSLCESSAFFWEGFLYSFKAMKLV